MPRLVQVPPLLVLAARILQLPRVLFALPLALARELEPLCARAVELGLVLVSAVEGGVSGEAWGWGGEEVLGLCRRGREGGNERERVGRERTVTCNYSSPAVDSDTRRSW